MTCKDCIHYDICTMAFASCDMAYEECEHFKEKSRFIELPCKVGELVYCIHENKVLPCIVINFYIDFIGIMCDLKISTNNCSPNSCTSTNIIIQFTKCNIFLTKEEAEAKLKEGEN